MTEEVTCTNNVLVLKRNCLVAWSVSRQMYPENIKNEHIGFV